MTTILTGSFPNANGDLARHDRMPVEVTRDGHSLHFRLAGSGHGSVAVSDGSGIGTFRTLDDRAFVFALEPDRSGTRYRLLENDKEIATGMLYDLPP